MKRIWDWHASACILELGNHLKEKKAARVISDELKKLFDKAPTHSAIIAQLRRSSLPLGLEQVFGASTAQAFLAEFHARANPKEPSEPRKPSALKRELAARATKHCSITIGETTLGFREPASRDVSVAPRQLTLREISDPEVYLARYYENEIARDSRVRMCRGKDDTCTERPSGGPYCKCCGKDLYQVPTGRKSSDRDLERLVRTGQ